MTHKFKASPCNGTFEDMGLCYVSKITMDDGCEIVSYISKDKATAESRLAEDIAAIKSYGYEFEGAIE